MYTRTQDRTSCTLLFIFNFLSLITNFQLMCVRLKASYLSALAHAEHSINPTSNFKSHCSYYNEHCEAVLDLGIAYLARAGDFCMNQTLNWHYLSTFYKSGQQSRTGENSVSWSDLEKWPHFSQSQTLVQSDLVLMTNLWKIQG